MNRARDFREFLKSELAQRFKRNPRYSMRAFARDLNLSSARLSDILHHQKGMSRAVAIDVAKRLSLNTGEQEWFADLVEKDHGRSKLARAAADARLKKKNETAILGANEEDSLASTDTALDIYYLTLDCFRAVEDWYHMAVLQILKLKGPKKNPEEIAKRLNLSIYEVRDALDRLERLKLVVKRGSGYQAKEGWIQVREDGVPSSSLKKLHEQLLEKAILALHRFPIDQRSFRSSILSVDRKKIPEIGEKIRKFSESIIKKYNTLNSDAEVMGLALHAFPLSAAPTQGEKK